MSTQKLGQNARRRISRRRTAVRRPLQKTAGVPSGIETGFRCRNILEKAGAGIAITDARGRFVSFNRGLSRMLGYSRDELAGKSFRTFLLPEDRKKLSPAEEEKLRTVPDATFTREYRIRRKDGRVRWLQEIIQSAFDPDGNLKGFQSIIHDITDRKHVEETLETNREKYANLFHKSNDAIFIHDLEGNILDVNRKTLRMFGYRKPEILALKIPDIHPESELGTSRKAFRTIKKKGAVSFECLFKRKDGSVFPAEVSSSLFRAGGKTLVQGIVRDITSRKQAEEALRESEMRYRALFESAHDAVFLMNLKGEQVMVNKRAVQLLGYSLKELNGKSFRDIIAPSETQDAEKKLEGLLAGKKFKPYERIVRRKDGKEIPVEISLALIRDRDGRPLFVQSVVRDISERKHAIEKLRESRELYKTLMETSPDAVTATDLKGTITYASRRTAELYGVKDAAQMVGKNALDFIAPEDRERALENMKKTLEKGTVREVMYRGLRKDGSVFISELNASLIRDAHGKPKAFIATTRDVTERRRIQEQLAQSEQRFRSLVESANDAIYIITPEGFEYVNPAFEKLTGYSSKQVCQKNFNFWNIIHPDDVTMIQQREEARKRGEEVPSRYEFRILAKNGKVKVVEPATVNIGEKGEARVMGILRDVTERKRAEDILRTSLEEKEVLLREIHHRVKNNMQIISSLLRLQARTIKDPRMQEMFKESQNRIRSMALIHEKLYQTEDLTRINFAQYIRSLTVHLFHTYKVNPNIVRINTRVDDIFLDINRAIPCGLVVNELVSNSLKHAFPDGRKGEIRILLTREKRKKVRLVVGDNGVGLPQEVDHRDPRTLGLQLVYDLVRQLDGKIRLDRTKGSTFVITFQA